MRGLPLDEFEAAPAAGGICGDLPRHLLCEVAEVVSETMGDHGLRLPGASLLVVGSHPTALSYARETIAAARAANVELHVTQLPADTPQDHVAALICRLNKDAACHGIVLQLPLPPHLDATSLIDLVHDDKDVDCLKESSVRRCLVSSEPAVGPCIASACEEVLRSLDILRTPKPNARRGPGPAVLLLGVPPLLAFPLEMCLEAAGCRVACLTDDHDTTAARSELHRADVLVIGARRPDVVAAQWVRSGCVLLDLGLASATAPSPVGLAAWQQLHSHPSSCLGGGPIMECEDAEVVEDDATCHSGSRYRAQGVARVNSSSSSSSSSEGTCVHDTATDIPQGTDAPQGAPTSDGSRKVDVRGSGGDDTTVLTTPPGAAHELGSAEAGDSAHGNAPDALELPAAFDAGSNAAAHPVALAPDLIGERSPFESWESEQRDVLCVCCSDGIASMTAALRMRNLSHAALLQQGFLESCETAKERPLGSPPLNNVGHSPPAMPPSMR